MNTKVEFSLHDSKMFADRRLDKVHSNAAYKFTYVQKPHFIVYMSILLLVVYAGTAKIGPRDRLLI